MKNKQLSKEGSSTSPLNNGADLLAQAIRASQKEAVEATLERCAERMKASSEKEMSNSKHLLTRITKRLESLEGNLKKEINKYLRDELHEHVDLHTQDHGGHVKELERKGSIK